MNALNITGMGPAVVGSRQGFLDDWETRAAATVKEFLTVECAGPRKTRKDTEGNAFFCEFRAFRGQKRGLA